MPAIACFEDIQAWQEGRELTREIYRLTGRGQFSRDYDLRDQIRRGSAAIISNIAKGYDRDSDRNLLTKTYQLGLY